MALPVTDATGGNIGAGANAEYTWANSVWRVFIQNHPSSGSTLYLSFDGSAASTTNWDIVLVPGDSVTVNYSKIVFPINIYATAAVTYGTDFTVWGWT